MSRVNQFCEALIFFKGGAFQAQIWCHYRGRPGQPENQLRFGSGPNLGKKNQNDPNEYVI